MPKRAGRNLTFKFIEGLKPSSKIQAFPDLTEGLELYVTPGGSKTFSFRYRLRDGTRRRVNLGRWPGLKLELARIQARALANDVAEGRDPLAEKKKELQALRSREVKTLEDLMQALLTASASNLRPSTLAYWTWLNTKHIVPRLEGRLEEITTGAIRAAIRDIGVVAGHTTANRTFSLLRRAYNFGLEEEHIERSPLGRMKPLFKEESRSRVLSDDEIRALWRMAEATRMDSRRGDAARDELGVSRPMACAVQLCLVTLQRGGEVIGITANELNLDEKTWTLPASRTKAKRDHVVPLSDLAVVIIREAADIAALKLGRPPNRADPIFPTARAADWERDEVGALKHSPKPAASLSLCRAMARLCEASSIADASAHDLRRTGSTIMASERIGVLSEVVARVLNHAPPGLGITAVYNRYTYLPEKRAALDRWARVLMEIVNAKALPA